MTNDEFGGFMAFVLLIAFLVAPAIAVDWWWKSETVNRGLAQYCSDTGDWAWVGECTPTPSTDAPAATDGGV